MALRLSVVIATYNRNALLEELLADLARQDIPAANFEVIVVDDGSKTKVKPRLEQLQPPYGLTVIEQENAGPAAARHRGAQAAAGEILVFVDDDMSLGPDFLRQHDAAHARGASVVQGYIAPPDDRAALPLFERFHAHHLGRFLLNVQRGRARLRGLDVCTGNVSVRRAAYHAVGGFDLTLGRSEDRELGLRLEKAGYKLALALAAKSRHRSDHDRLEVWLRRALAYGVFDLRIARKHPDWPEADPWRFWFEVSPLSRPLLLLSATAPAPMKKVARAVMATAMTVDRAGLERLALAGATLCYGMEYFRGVRDEAGLLGAYRGFLACAASRLLDWPGAYDLAAAIAADYAAVIKHRNKYNGDSLGFRHLPLDVVRKIGVQMTVAIRLMQAARDTVPAAAMVLSRLIRHLYDAEIHWDAELEPGLTIIHGNGLVISRSARVRAGCILFHNVTLGEGIDPISRQVGAPTLERNVHVGPGATLLGPIVIGEGTKIMAGALVTSSVPPFSLVRPAEAVVTPRQLSAVPVARA